MTDDNAMMRQFQQGSNEAFEQLVRSWEGPMLNYFYRCIGDLDAAEDLRQELFIRVYRRSSSWRGEGNFKAWLYAIATNLVRTHMRKAGRIVSIEDIDIQPAAKVTSHATTPAPADELAQRSQSARYVQEVLSSLAAEDREALILRFYEHLKYREISDILGVAESAAKSRVYRAIERMRQMVADRGWKAADLL